MELPGTLFWRLAVTMMTPLPVRAKEIATNHDETLVHDTH